MMHVHHDNNGQTLYPRLGLVTRVRRWYVERRTMSALDALSDPELKDIGVQRGGAAGLAREYLWMAGG